MKHKSLLRLAAFFLLLVAIGHTYGIFTRNSTDNPQKSQLLQEMQTVTFDIGGSLRTMDDLYAGASINSTITLVCLIWTLWIVTSLRSESKVKRMVLYPVLLCTSGLTVVSYLYFFIVPALCCTLAALAILFAIIKLYKEA